MPALYRMLPAFRHCSFLSIRVRVLLDGLVVHPEPACQRLQGVVPDLVFLLVEVEHERDVVQRVAGSEVPAAPVPP